MSAVLNPHGKADAVEAMLRDVRSKLATWLTREGIVPRGIPSEEVAETVMLDHLYGLAYDREGADAVGALGQASVKSMTWFLSVED